MRSKKIRYKVSKEQIIILKFQIYLFQFMNTVKGYRTNLRKRFQKQVTSITQKHHLEELVLVLDVNTAFILNNLFRITELVSMKLLFIERLQKKRKKLNKHALYFISPQRESILALSGDFTDDKNEPQYRRVHVLFSSFIDKGDLKVIATNPFLMKKIAKNSIKQFYCSAKILAENLVDFGIPYLQYAFGQEGDGQRLRRERIAKGLIEFVANFNQINTVKIYYKKSANYVCERMAKELQNTIKKYLGILIQNKSTNLVKSAKNITFLLLDRSIDPVTPLLHYFTYQALLFDLFEISMVGKRELVDKEGYSYQQIQNESYQKYRYKHISEALQKLPKTLEYEKNKLDDLKVGGHENISVRQMTEKIDDLRSNIEKLQMIWNRFEQMKLADLSDLQLSLTTGLTANGANTSSSKLVQQISSIIKNPEYPKQIKLRLALLCLCCIKLSKDDYIALIGLFQSQQKQILKNINALGVTYDSTASKSTKTITKEQQNIARQRMERTGMPLNRYTSILELVIPLFIRVLTDPMESQKLDSEIFGELTCSVFKENSDNNKFDSQKFGIMMIGGMSWAQTSALRSIADIDNAVLLTDTLYNPKQYIQSLAKLKLERK